MIGCETLVLIGNIDGESILVVDENGIIYSIYDGDVIRYGHTRQAIEILFNKSWSALKDLAVNKKLEDLDIDWKYVREKEIENHKRFLSKYKRNEAL
jgi:hypothetical protein